MAWSGLDRGRLAGIPEHCVEHMGGRRPSPSTQRRDQPLDGFDGDGANLDLFGRAHDEEIPRIDPTREGFGMVEHPMAAQDVGHEIVGKERQPIEIVEAAQPSWSEGAAEIGHRDLGAFIEGHDELFI